MHRINAVGNSNTYKQDILIVSNVLFFFCLLVLFEIRHQRILRSEVPFKSADVLQKSFSKQSFESEIRAGSKLVIIDNLVLDVSEFISVHPGGKFVIRHLVGTDVSKFFFGGYTLEENTVTKPKGHVHSVYAKLIVNDLAVGIYERDITVKTEVV